MVTKKERVLRGDHGVSVHHEALGQGSLPEDRPVESIEGDQRVQVGLLPRMPGHMTEGLEHAAGGRNGRLGRRPIAGIRQELGQVGRPRQTIEGTGIVVRTMHGMGPVIQTLGRCLDALLSPQQQTAPRTQDA